MSSVSGRNFVVSRPGWVSSRSSATSKMNRDNETAKKQNDEIFSFEACRSSFNNDPFTAAIYSPLIERKTCHLLYFYLHFYLTFLFSEISLVKLQLIKIN